jgi:uncharacterized protein
MCATSNVEAFANSTVDPPVQGFIHRPHSRNGKSLILTHGAGSNCRAPLLLALADRFADSGFLVLRCDLPYRQVRSVGPPRPADAARDRAGLERAIELIRQESGEIVYLGGHSYGGRQASMLVAEKPGVTDGLLLLSYPLHPPNKPQQMRTAHFSGLRTPVLFVQGTKDPFASREELEKAMELIPGEHERLQVEGAGHDLGFKAKGGRADLPEMILRKFSEFFT